jgi:hypothetical protein
MPTCFVAMGFGVKTAFYGGRKKPRTLDLDKTYYNIIKPAATAAGLVCIRADEILHTTLIDKPMFEHLLAADVVVADVSTSNANAIYELGVRHALRPWTTVVIAENEFAFPFDINHLGIMRYEHLGKDIGASEAKEKSAKLTELLKEALAARQVDSPVFLFLPQLSETATQSSPAKPVEREKSLAERMVEGLLPSATSIFKHALGENAFRVDATILNGIAPSDPADGERRASEARGPSLADVKGAFESAKAMAKTAENWGAVAARLEDWRRLEPNDPFVIQQLALATYKSEVPDAVGALERARSVLSALQPEASSDPETVGLWGAIHKRLWDARQNPVDLKEAIRSYARGFYIRQDHYNGINLAFLLDVRANLTTGEDAIADRVYAARVRREVVDICDRELKEAEMSAESRPPDELYWVRASRAEALLGLGDSEAGRREFEEAANAEPRPKPWMVEATDKQMDSLRRLIAERNN